MPTAKRHPKKKKDKHRHELISRTIGKIQSGLAKAKNQLRQEKEVR